MTNPNLVIAAAVEPVAEGLVAVERRLADLETRPPGRDGRDGAGVDAPAWAAGPKPEGAVVSHYQGQIFRALRPTDEEPGTGDHWERVGTVGTRWRGLRSEGMTLVAGDVYRSTDGTVYQVDHNGEPFPLAARGAPGDPGAPGSPGADGRDGLGLEAPAWESRVYREGSVVTHNLGQVFRALVDTVGEPGESADWKRLGSGGLRWRGAAEEGATYEPGDLVTLDGSFFWTDHKGQRHLAAHRGERGRRGDPGAPGKDGRDGDALLDVTLGTSSLVFRFGGPGGEREVEVDITDQVEAVAAALIARHVRPALEEIIRRVVDLERRP